MESSWQIKCSSGWQTSAHSMPSSSQLPPQGSRNQSGMNAGHYFNPYTEHIPSSTARGVAQERMAFNTPNLASSKSGRLEMAESFLALLSGPPSQFQHDFQSFLSPQSSITASNCSMHDRTLMVNAADRQPPVAPVRSFLHHVENEHMRNGELCSDVRSRQVPCSNSDCLSVLHGNHNLSGVTLESRKTLVNHTVRDDEIQRDLLGWGQLASLNHVNSGKLQTTHIQAPKKISSEVKSAFPGHSSSSTGGYPRVVCMGSSGDLLLSNSGLLGVVCSCHGLHMSISKFCEHSGLFSINPGHAVCMESGEPVAQWRKTYFHKFGFRVLDDHSGWDWPEGFSAAGGLVKCRATLPNISKNSYMFQSVDSNVVARSGSNFNDFMFPKNPLMGRTVLEKSENKVMHEAQLRNAPEGHDVLLKSMMTSYRNLPAQADSQIIKKCPISGALLTSKPVLDVRQKDSCYQSISDCMDVISRGCDSLISIPNSGNLMSLGAYSGANNFNSSKGNCVVDRGDISSKVDLRLGQPSQQNYVLGGSVISSVGTPPFETIGDRQKSHFQDHTIHSTINAGIAAESRPNLWPALFDTLSSNKVEEKCSLNFMQHALGGKDAVDPNKFEQYKSDDAKNSLISMFLPQRNAPSEGNPKSQANNNMVNVNEKIMPRMPYGESHLANCGTDSFQWKRSDGSEWQLCIDGQCLRSHLDKGKEIRCFADGSVSAKSNLVLHNEQVENLSSFNGVISEHSVSGSSMLPEKQFSYLCQLSGLPQDLSDANKSLNHRSGKVSCLESNGNIDHAFHRSINSFPVTAESDFPPPAASIGLSSLASSIYRTKPTPFLSTKEGSDASTHSLDENLRLLALRHVFELSKREHPVSSIDLNPQVGLNGPLGMEMHRKGFIENPSVSEVVRQNPYLNIVQDSTEMAVRSFESCTSQNISGGIKQLAAVAGLKNWCNLSTAAEGISIHSEELGTSDTPSHAPLMDKQYLLRARDENTACLEHEGCYWKDSKPPFLGKCSCAVHSKFIAAKCGSSGRSSFDAYKEIVGSVGEKASNLVSPIFSKGHNIKDVRAVVVDQCGNLNRMTVDPCDAEWRDIPSKGTEIINATCIDNPVELLGSRGNVENQFKDKGFNVTVEDEMLKEQQMSNACSGCSAPAVTEVSVEANNMDSCTVNASNPGYLKGVLVDEGSGIDSWSSDNDFDSCDSAKFINVTHKSDSIKGISSTNLPYKSSRGPVDDLKLKGSFKPKKVRNGRINHRKQVEDLKSEKLKRTKKWERVNAYESHRCTYGTEQHSCSSEEINIPSRSDSQTCGIYSSESSVLKRKRSSLFSLEIHSRKRDGFRLKHQTQWEDDYRTQSKDDMNFVKRPKLLDGKKFKKGWTGDVTKQFVRQEQFQLDGEGAAKHISADKSFSGVQMSKFDKKRRPIVCGKFGIISSGKMTEDPAKPAKIVSLSSVLKIARRCSISGNESPKLASTLGTKEKSFRSKRCYDKPHILKIMRNNEGYNTTLDDEDPGSACIEKNKACFNDKKIFDNNIFTWDKKRVNGGHRKCKILHECSNGQSKIRFKEARQRSLYELSVKGKDSNCAELSKIMQQTPQNERRAQGKSCLENEEDSKLRMSNLCQLNAKRSIKENKCQVLMSDLDAFCCVCGSSNKDEINSLLECSRCLIKVHQACYGVSKAPKGRWCCRPCRTNSKNIACVLCGYEGGAMTRAIHSRNVVKSLLKTWNIISETKPMNSVLISGTLQNEFCMLDSSRSVDEADIKSCPATVRGMDLLKELDASKNTNVSPSILQVHNSITAGVHDSTVKQWVHMVCGLWTPGTRCPNVDTMSAFDVSGASQLRKNEICSLCNRPGGSCIQCRVVNCCVQFHPWCAHRKGLLQSEVEGVDSENVGFYGRCLLHATHHRYGPDNHPIDTDIDGAGKRETTCARTEGYKGRKGEGFMHNLRGQTNDNGGCLVPQEQINAWLHINGQKSCSRGLPKPLASDVEYDCRKEYARYKQAKGWKHLVVYKSGIHALGLYTSRFIARGSMVVEYVGEIVGLRVADKRENDYQSGRKLQYKSACYFFRIDKEHIIDATRKGGIARFVNHSCLPNCVAKVISVRNEKKVVFFAERDINLGEEITYDYHFNHEDEGKKIPCFCKSKNCRRYLN